MKKNILFLGLACTIGIAMMGCAKEEVLVQIPESMLQTEGPGKEVVETTVNETAPLIEDVGQENPVEQIPEEDMEFSAFYLATKAYESIAAPERMIATGEMSNVSERTSLLIHWDNVTGEVFTKEEGEQIQNADKGFEPFKSEKCTQWEGDCYVSYQTTWRKNNDAWSVASCSKGLAQMQKYVGLREMFFGAFELEVDDELVYINDEPHYHLTGDGEPREYIWDMYIKCSDLTLSRVERVEDDYSCVLNFAKTEEIVAASPELVASVEHMEFDADGEVDDVELVLPGLGHEMLSDVKVLNVDGVAIIMGDTAEKMLNHNWETFSCELDAYYINNDYLHDDGGDVPAGAYAYYFIEAEESADITMVVTCNDTDGDLKPQDCVIKGIVHIGSLESYAGRPLTMLDAVYSLGEDYEELTGDMYGWFAKWLVEDYTVLITSDSGELFTFFILHDDVLYLAENILGDIE